MTDASNIQAVAVLTENGLVVSLRNPDELELAYRWALNGSAVSFHIRVDDKTESKGEQPAQPAIEPLDSYGDNDHAI
ncbi:hypothetical protein P12x_005291 [Tundrisphaera lichenicola]|uniref:hypothetical protein n=1 Tax=Tundrisphaera lichenicola TaxID=2029860 RepID=UPI003EBFCEBC